ncbi:MAG: metallophosphoesterase family protein [Chloroflexi bacterium]|nr:metallophosphoesterase family protein [Chloroflexota bacterium]
MDRIAIISDLHGNIPALEATLEDIRRREISRVFCLGDLVGKGPHSARAVDLCREVCELTVRGNWDDFIVVQPEHPIAQWHREQLGPERLEYLAQLPYVIDFWMSGKPVRLFHASQIGIYHRVLMSAPFDVQLAMFENTAFTGDSITPTVVGYGDIHWAFLHCFEQRILFNVGSVGNPLDLTQASYAILEGQYGSRQESAFSIQHVRVPYDIERAIHDAQAMQMPDLQPYINELRTARYRGAVPPAEE